MTNKNKQVERCFLNYNSSIHFCCTDSLLMTYHGGLSLSIIIWRIGGGGQSLRLHWGPKILGLAGTVVSVKKHGGRCFRGESRCFK